MATNAFSDKTLYTTTAVQNAENLYTPSGEATWATIPTAEELIQTYESANEDNATATALEVYYGVRATTDIPSGTYSGTVTYTAVSEGANTNDATMQDFTTAECRALTTATTDNYGVAHIELIDERDGKWYTVAKMADGNCWMTQNLALDGGITLTPEDSNVTQNRPLAKNIEDGEESAYDTVQIYSGNADSATSSCNTSYPYCITSDTKYGNLYNWNAATAGTGKQATTGTVYESICPKGWRLPDNGTTAGLKSYSNLVSKYSYTLNGTTTQLSPINTTDGNMVIRIQQAPLNFPLAGSYNNSSVNQGRYAIYWSRAVHGGNTDHAYDLNFNAENGGFNPHGYNPKYYGISVRCVLGE